MADDGKKCASSSDSIEEVKERPDNQPSHFASSFTSNSNESSVTSSGHMASGSQGKPFALIGAIGAPHFLQINEVFLLGKEGGNASTNPFAIKSSAPARSVADSTESKESRPLLAPPTLKLGNSETPKIVLRPSALSVQAEKLKLVGKHDSSSKQEGKENSSDESNVAKKICLNPCDSNGKASKSELFTSAVVSSSEASVSSPSKQCPPSSAAENTFSLAPKNSDEQSANGGFIFGQNLHERALNYDSNSEQPLSPTDSHNLTFEEAALKKEELEKMERQNQEEKLKSLSESAKEYESKQVKRKFDEVTVITGEEEESNVLQINCKLFAFDKVNMNWQERGRGILRLNDKEFNGSLDSRVVMRTHGNFRVVLNTKVWAGMTVEHPSKKTVRLTAYDPQGVKVFLVTAQPKDAEQLFNALDWRVATLKAQDTSAKQPLRNTENQSTIAEASSSLPNASHDDSSDNSIQGTPFSENSCYGADSSSETNFKPLNSSGDTGEGAPDSTNSQS